MGGIHLWRMPEGVVRIVIDNPPANPLDHALRERFEAVLDEIEADLDVRAAILTGVGDAFCSGDDLKQARGRGEEMLPSLHQFMRLANKLENLRVPTVCAVNGYAIGGGLELALCCDIRIASDWGWFRGAGVNIGLFASTFRLPRLVGVAAAKAMLLTAERVDANAALAMGLVTAVHHPKTLPDAAALLATRIATRAPLSVEATKRMIGRSFEMDQASADAIAREELAILAASEDHRAAVEAFHEGREPDFKRR